MASPAGALPDELRLATEAHVKYIQSLDTRKEDYDYWLTEHLRLNGVYWGLVALHILGYPEALPRDATIDFVLSCQHESGGFGAAPGHDAHMLSTVSAVQILAMVDALDELDKRGKGNAAKVGKCRLDLVDVGRAVEHVAACANFDGGYGVRPGAESHSGQILTCVAALAIAGRLDLIDTDRLGRWLSERQVPAGGLNGRPEKQEDVCYSWWVLASLEIVGRTHWIDRDALASFILRCQDIERGGVSDRPGNQVDVWHTCFGIAGLSLLKWPGLEAVDPVYCMPKSTIERVLGRK
ncbi:hypothetical protein RB595_007198 [Gaeumannomyces hyphopodioides]